MQTSFLRLLSENERLRRENRLLKLENNNLKGAIDALNVETAENLLAEIADKHKRRLAR